MNMYLEARTVATSALLTASSSRSRYTAGDSSSCRGFGISTDGLENDGRAELDKLVGGDSVKPSPVTFAEEFAEDGEPNKLTDKRCKRGGFVWARGLIFAVFEGKVALLGAVPLGIWWRDGEGVTKGTDSGI